MLARTKVAAVSIFQAQTTRKYIMFPSGPERPDDDCDGWKQKLLGKTIVKNKDDVHANSENIFLEENLPTLHRVLPPNTMMTMDYRPDRLNVKVDKNMRVLGVHYG